MSQLLGSRVVVDGLRCGSNWRVLCPAGVDRASSPSVASLGVVLRERDTTRVAKEIRTAEAPKGAGKRIRAVRWQDSAR